MLTVSHEKRVFPEVFDHTVYGLSIEVAPRHYFAARPDGWGRGWRVEESHQGLTIHARGLTRALAYQLAADMAGIGDTEQVAAA